MRRALKRIGLAAVVVAVLAVFAPSVRAVECSGIALDDGCLFTTTGSDTPDPNDGFAVTNAYGVPMWDFVKERDLEALGYPISHRWVDGVFTLQAFQKVILQWDTSAGRMYYYNTLDALADHYPAVELPFVPAHQVLEAVQGTDFGTVMRNHLEILEHNAAIKERFLADPDWLNLYGLPIAYEEREVNGNPQGVQLLRSQRTVFVIWNVPTPGTTVGRVQLQNIPDKVKELSNVIIPDRVKRPMPQLDTGTVDFLQLLTSSSILSNPIETNPLAQASAYLMETIALTAPDLFSYFLRDSAASWNFLSPSNLDNPRFFEFSLELADLPWTQDGLTRNERVAVDLILNDARHHEWPRYARQLVRMDWFRDGINEDEVWVINTMGNYMYEIWTRASNPPGVSRDAARLYARNVVSKLLFMPFMQSIDGVELDAITRLFDKYAGERTGSPERIVNAILHIESRGGLTDDQAILFAYTGLSHIADTTAPEHLDIYLNPRHAGYTSDVGVIIDKHRVSLPISGDMLLAVVRRAHTAGLPVHVVEKAIRSIESGTKIPYRSNNIHIFLKENLYYAPTLHERSFIWMRGAGMHGDAGGERPSSSLLYRLANRYWTIWPMVSHLWLTGGASNFVMVASGQVGRDYVEAIDAGCRYNRTRDTFASYADYSACNYGLGAGLFLDLYSHLGDAAFYRRFARLYDQMADIRSRRWREGIAAEEDIGLGLQYLQHAFLTDTDPATAEVINRIVDYWLHGIR